MDKYSKAIAAGVGGALGTTGITFAIPPDVPAPWWGYLIAYAVGILAPMVITWRAPANK